MLTFMMANAMSQTTGDSGMVSNESPESTESIETTEITSEPNGPDEDEG